MNAKILIVEDENIVSNDLKNTLRNLGYDVSDIAASGKDAIRKAAEVDPDLVLMDIILKGEIDGVEAAEQIRDRFKIPVVYLTAYADDKTFDRAKITDPYGYVLKPFQEKELSTTIEMALYRSKIEKEAKERERWLEATLNCIKDAVVTADDRGRVTFVNLMAEALTGWKREEALGRPLNEVCPIIHEVNRAPIENFAKKAMTDHVASGATHQYMLISKEGNQIPIDTSSVPIKDDKGDVKGSVSVFRDVTERKRVEEKVREMNEVKSQVASFVSYELRTPLTVIKEALELVFDESLGPLGEERKRDLEIARRNVDRLTRLINGIADFPRI